MDKSQGGGLHDLELGHGGVADIIDFLEPGGRRGDHFGEGAEFLQQHLGERLDVAAGNGAKQQQFEQFIIGQSLGAALQESLAQPFAVAGVERFW